MVYYVNLHTVGFIGAGNIASAIISGMINSCKMSAWDICVFDTDISKLEHFAALGVRICNSGKDVIEYSDYIFLTVKPQIYPVVLDEIKDFDLKGKCLVDIGAGISTEFVKSFVGNDAEVVRVMPNTPLMLGCGATAIAVDGVDADRLEYINYIFSPCGKTEFVSECDINTVTAVSGSGPAFVFKFAKAVIEAADELGMNREAAKNLIAQTLIGGARMITDSSMSIDELIKMVSSPNGTTVAGLKALEDNVFDAAVKSAIFAAKQRADELSNQE